MKSLRLIILSLLALALTISSGVSSAEKPVATLPFKLVGNTVLIEVKLNEHQRPFNFVFDTGASATVFDKREARTLKLEPDFSAGVEGASGDSRSFEMCLNQKISIQDHTLEGVNLVLTDLKVVSKFIGRPIAGIVGSDLLRNHVVRVDNSKQIISLFKSANDLDTSEYSPIPIKLTPQTPNPVIEVEIGLLSGDKISAKVTFDTGNSGTLNINSSLIEEKSKNYYLTESVGINGVYKDKTVEIKSLSIGDFKLGNMEIKLRQKGESGSQDTSQVGKWLLGNEVLKRFDYIIDYSSATIFIRPNANFDKPVKFSVDGIRLINEGGKITVHNIINGSNAEKVGIIPGQYLISIDGQPAIDLAQVRKWLSEEGSVVSLVIANQDGTQREVQLHLERLL